MSSPANGHITVLNPTAPPRELRHTMALRPADLRGQAVGFLWNSKPNGDLLFGRLEELLRTKYEISAATYRRKPTASIPASGTVIDELAASVQVAVVGLGD
jgi:hypothetical protein